MKSTYIYMLLNLHFYAPQLTFICSSTYIYMLHSISYSNVIHLLEYAIPLSVCLSVCVKNVDPSSFEDNQMKLTKWPGALTVRSRLAEVGQTRERCSPKGQGFK